MTTKYRNSNGSFQTSHDVKVNNMLKTQYKFATHLLSFENRAAMMLQTSHPQFVGLKTLLIYHISNLKL